MTPGAEVREPYRDVAGRVISVGDYVAYAALGGRSALLKFGRVTALKEREPRWGGEHTTRTIGVVSVDGWGGDRWELQNNGREVTLSFLHRLVVVGRVQVPAKALELLDQVS